MYTVIGIKPDASAPPCKPLQYPTLQEAMQKLQDLIEADEMEVEGGQEAMFVRYTVVPKISHATTPAPAPTHETGKPSLRLVR